MFLWLFCFSGFSDNIRLSDLLEILFFSIIVILLCLLPYTHHYMLLQYLFYYDNLISSAYLNSSIYSHALSLPFASRLPNMKYWRVFVLPGLPRLSGISVLLCLSGFFVIISNLHQLVISVYPDYLDYRFALFFWFTMLTILPRFSGLLCISGFSGFSVILVY